MVQETHHCPWLLGGRILGGLKWASRRRYHWEFAAVAAVEALVVAVVAALVKLKNPMLADHHSFLPCSTRNLRGSSLAVVACPSKSEWSTFHAMAPPCLRSFLSSRFQSYSSCESDVRLVSRRVGNCYLNERQMRVIVLGAFCG